MDIKSKDMKHFWMICLGGLLGLAACSEDKLTGYSGDSYIYFAKESCDSTVFSFAYDKNLTEGDLSLKLNMVSVLESRERTFAVRFLPEESTAKEGVHFELNAAEQTVAANDSVGYMHLNIKKGDLHENMVTAVFELMESDDFKVGLPAHTKARVIISDKLSQPDWWDNWHETSGLGAYTDLKYAAFIEEMGVHDLTMEKDGGTLTYSEVRSLILRFKRILGKNPRPDKDGSTMSVAMNG